MASSFLPDSEGGRNGALVPSSMLTSVHPFSLLMVLKKCALVALHFIAEEGRGGEDGCHAPGLEEWKVGCPKSPMWESEGEAWSEDESWCLLVAFVKAMCATMRCTSSGCMDLVARSLFS